MAGGVPYARMCSQNTQQHTHTHTQKALRQWKSSDMATDAVGQAHFCLPHTKADKHTKTHTMHTRKIIFTFIFMCYSVSHVCSLCSVVQKAISPGFMVYSAQYRNIQHRFLDTEPMGIFHCAVHFTLCTLLPLQCTHSLHSVFIHSNDVSQPQSLLLWRLHPPTLSHSTVESVTRSHVRTYVKFKHRTGEHTQRHESTYHSGI